MKKVLFTLLATISLTTFGQNTLTRDDYVYPYPIEYGSEGIWGDSYKVYNEKVSMYEMKTPLNNLKYGSKDLLRANNYKLYSMACVTTSSLLLGGASFIAPDTNPESELRWSARMLGLGLGLTGIYYHFAGLTHERRAIKRMYWGMNGITIPLNQE